MTPAQYADQWKVASASIHKDGHYAWMLSELGSASTILEVGSGAGASTYALAQAGKRVVSIEINEHALDLSRQHLLDQGISAEVISVSDLLKSRASAQVCLIHGDICSAEILALTPTGMFEALVCWLMGASPYSISNALDKPLEDLIERDVLRYRHGILRNCYELGRKVLPATSIVHVVDRLAISSWNDRGYFKERLAEGYRDLAGEGYRTQAHNVSLRQIEGNFDNSQIQYNSDDRAPHRILASVRSVRTADA